MNTSLLIKKTESLAVEKFKRPKDIQRLKKTHIAYSGAPRKHPHDPYRILLVVDPFSRNTFYYEFKMDDIAFVEELPSIVNLDDDIIPVMRLWIRKGSVGMRCTPFVVEETF